jgi:hypothetical protein
MFILGSGSLRLHGWLSFLCFEWFIDNWVYTNSSTECNSYVYTMFIAYVSIYLAFWAKGETKAIGSNGTQQAKERLHLPVA